MGAYTCGFIFIELAFEFVRNKEGGKSIGGLVRKGIVTCNFTLRGDDKLLRNLESIKLKLSN